MATEIELTEELKAEIENQDKGDAVDVSPIEEVSYGDR